VIHDFWQVSATRGLAMGQRADFRKGGLSAICCARRTLSFPLAGPESDFPRQAHTPASRFRVGAQQQSSSHSSKLDLRGELPAPGAKQLLGREIALKRVGAQRQSSSHSSKPDLRRELPAASAERLLLRALPYSGLERSDRVHPTAASPTCAASCLQQALNDCCSGRYPIAGWSAATE
jgi:hypothetical protein